MEKSFENYHTNESNISMSRLSIIWLNIIKRLPILNSKIALIMKLPLNSKVLDVGCGECSFLKYVHKIRPDLKLYGVDLSKDLEAKIPRYIKFKTGSGYKLPFKKNTFDLVTCQHVIEHVDDPVRLISEINRVNKHWILIVAPNYKNIFLWDKHNFWHDPTHIRPFTIASLEKTLRMSKYNVLLCKHERYLNVPWILLLFMFPINLIFRWVEIGDYISNLLIKRGVMAIGQKELLNEN